MHKSHATLLMFVASAAYWVIGPLLAAYDCYHLSDALTAGRELYLAAAFRAMGLTALPWAAAMILFAGLWAIFPADKPRSPYEP